MIIFMMLISNNTLRNATVIKEIKLIFIIEILIFYTIVKKYFNQIVEVYSNNNLRGKLFLYLEFLASCCWITALGINSKENYWYLLENFANTSIAGSAFICNLILIGKDIFIKLRVK